MDWKRLGKKLIFPPIWAMMLLSVMCGTALIAIFVKGFEKSLIAYVVYVLSFYTLSVVCVFFGIVFPRQYRQIKQKIYGNPIGNRYMTDMAFRTHISLYISLGINLLYVGVNILSFLFFSSMWFVVLGVYYSILAIMRFLLLRYVNRIGIGNNRLGELKRTVLCSSILLTLNFVLTGAVLMILYQNRGFNYQSILIYVVALFTFYITTHAIINLIKYRKYNSPVMTMTKVITLSAALVSMLALETAMFSQFGAEMKPDDQRLMIALTGAGVSIIVVTMSIYIIVKSVKEIRNIKEKINE
ncbi:MAG: hypothetical protein E7252_07115 [Lachnospira sp.]|nr:hypothetical protein [Lachnospira sp.]